MRRAGWLIAVVLMPQQASVEAGLELLRRGDAEGAAIELRRVVEADPSSAAARFHLGRALFATDMDSAWPEAWLQFSEALAIDPGLRPAEFQRAELCYRVGRVEEARVRLEALADITPRWPDPEVRAAELALEQGEAAEAVRWLDRALEIAPGHSGLWVRRAEAMSYGFDRGGAVASYRRALALTPEATTIQVGLAYELFNQQRFDAAVQALEHARNSVPDDPSVLLPYGEALLYLGDTDRALDAIDDAWAALEARSSAAPELAGLRAGVLEMRARTLLKTGNIVEAAAAARQLVRYEPAHVQGRFLYGNALRQMGDPAAAEQLKEFKRLSDAREHRELADEYLRLAGDGSAAIVAYRAALERVPEDVAARVGLARAQFVEGDPAAALGTLAQIPSGQFTAAGIGVQIQALAATGGREQAAALWRDARARGLRFGPEVWAVTRSHLAVCDGPPG